METILATYEGHTIFSIFAHFYEVYEKIHSQMKELTFPKKMNIKKEEMENTSLRRFHRILNMPTTDLMKPKPDKTPIAIESGCKFCLGVKPISSENEEEVEESENCHCKGYMSV